jgi:SynChlorMet cassette radical SAM/SPASM protein ScmF
MLERTATSSKATGREHRLHSIYFYLTDDCNLRCRHCWIRPSYLDGAPASIPRLDAELFASIVEQGLPMGLQAVKLTGGEPLLHPQIRRILETIRSRSLRLIVETNGVLCTRELVEQIAACRSPAISVSLDGADAATHEWMRGVPGSFDAAVEGLRTLVRAGLRPQIIMSIARHNQDQVEAIVRLAESLGVSSIKFNLIQPTARGRVMQERGELLSLEELVELGARVEGEVTRSTKLFLYHSHPVAFRPLGKLLGPNRDGCHLCKLLNIIGVLADGSYALCGIGEIVPELVFGDAVKDRLADIWERTPVLRELRTGVPDRLEGVCARCLHREVCRGSCIAQNFLMTRSLWSSHWYCQTALEKGLFPLTRLAPSPSREVPTCAGS